MDAQRSRLGEAPGAAALPRREEGRRVNLGRLPHPPGRDPSQQRGAGTALGPARAPRLALGEVGAEVWSHAPEATVPPVQGLAVVIVSHDQSRWLPRCLTTLREHLGDVDADVLVVDNGTQDDVGELEEARVLRIENRGYGHANNVGLAATDAPWVLFLNPDTEILDGSLSELLDRLDARPDIGIAGVRQVDATGALTPTMRSFPTAARTLGDALGLERWPSRPGWLGERELRLDRYEIEFEGDWTIGSFLLVRRETLDAVGGFDESFFLYSEEVDLCLRVREAGWKVLHVPSVTILHHGSTGRALDPKLASQSAWGQLQYARKHLPAHSRAGLRAALVVRYGIRSLHGDGRRRRAARAATALTLGLRSPPFQPATKQ
jgi:N-acetylglucosaminyl-diphospho-decaprenol L-rhamnosyltransferase